MAGVRVRHLFDRNCRWTLVERDIRYSQPRQCTPPEFGGCGRVHIFKTHHLNLDETGAVIIGDVLFAKLRPLLVANGFEVDGEVERPPAMAIGLAKPVEGRGAWGNIPIIGGEGDG